MSDRICRVFAFIIFLALLVPCGCGSAQLAESEIPEAGEQIELCWKGAKGEKLYYEYCEQISETGEAPEKEIIISWGEDKAAVSIEDEIVIMDTKGQFYNAENLSLPPQERIGFQLACLFPLPDRKIKTGESWTTEVSGKEGKPFSGTVTAVLLGFERHQGRNCAVIAISAKSTTTVETRGFTFTALKALSGTTLFDITAGRFVKGELEGEIISTSRLKPEKAEEMTSPEQKTAQKIVLRYNLGSK